MFEKAVSVLKLQCNVMDCKMNGHKWLPGTLGGKKHIQNSKTDSIYSKKPSPKTSQILQYGPLKVYG